MACRSKVVDAVLFLGSQVTPERVIAGTAALEALFYGCLKVNPNQEPAIVHWMRDTTAEYIREVQTLFNLVNAAASLYYAKRFLESANSRFYFAATLPQNLTRHLPLALATASIGALILHNFLSHSCLKNPEPKPGDVLTSESTYRTQTLAKTLHTTKLILNAAWGVFSRDRMAQVFDLLQTGYSYAQNLKVNWLKYSWVGDTDKPEFTGNGIEAVFVTYSFLRRPVNDPPVDECGSCFEDAIKKDVAWCSNHLSHLECVKKTLASPTRTGRILNKSRFQAIRTSYHPSAPLLGYRVTLNPENVQNCPTCRRIPPASSYDIQVKNKTGIFESTAAIGETDPALLQSKAHAEKMDMLIENLVAAYSIVQVGLAYLQTYPQLAGTIYKIQSAMILIDLCSLFAVGVTLKKRVASKWEEGFQNPLMNKILFPAAVTMTFAFSYFAVFQLNAYSKSTLILKDLVSKLLINPDPLKTLSAEWTSPISHTLLQSLYMSRVIGSLALACFTENRRANIVSAVAQLLSLAGLSSLKWIEFQQRIGWPLWAIVAPGKGVLSSNLRLNSVSELTLTSRFLVAGQYANDSNHLHDTLQSINNFVRRTFDHSSWDSLRLDQEEWIRHPHFVVHLQNKMIEFVGKTVAPFFWDHHLSLLNKHGTPATVDLRHLILT